MGNVGPYPFLLYFLEPLHNPPPRALSLPSAQSLLDILAKPHSPTAALITCLSLRCCPPPWCLLHVVQTAQLPTCLHSLHPHPSGLSKHPSTTACFTCLSFLTLRLLFMPNSHRGGVPARVWRGVKEGSIFFKPRAHSLNKTILRHLMCKTNPATLPGASGHALYP